MARPKNSLNLDNSPIEDIEISHGFMGSPNLKRVGEKIYWTENRILEYAKCERDPIYFVENYMKIIQVDRGLIPFKLFDFQKEMLMSMVENRNTIITTARQIGKSTVTCAFILWYVLFNKDKTVALLANKGDTAREIMGKVALAYEHLPKWIQQGVKQAAKGSLVLENNSRIIATATSGTAIRGYSINVLFIDEAAFIENWEEFFTAVVPTISSGTTTKMILVSTPNGLNHYYKLWTNAKEKRTDYNPIEVTWDKVPDRDASWAASTLANLNFDQDKFNQENMCAFLGSSGTLITGQALGELVHQNPINEHDGLYQYIKPEPDRLYAIICDVSKGKKLDYSAFSIFDVSTMPYVQAATFYNNEVSPTEYAEIIHMNAKMYNDAVVLVELNNIGDSVATMLYQDMEYEGLLFTESSGRNGKQISLGGSANKNGIDKGITTTSVVKSKGCSLLKLLVEQKQLIINDFNTISELSTFSRKGKSYEAESGCHDDLVMGLVLFAWLTDQKFFKEFTDINTLQRLRDRREEDIENTMVPFGYRLDGREQYDALGHRGAVIIHTNNFDKELMSDTQSVDRELEIAMRLIFG